MKILVISQLYHIEGRPELVHDTSAVHYLAQYWTEDNEVLVINNYINYRNRIFRYLKKQDRYYFKNNYEFTKDNIKVHVIENQLLTRRIFQKWNWKYLKKKVNEVLEKEHFEPDIIVTHFPCYSYEIINELPFDVPKIAVLHQSDMKHTELDPKMFEQLRLFDKCFCRSRQIYEFFDALGLDNLSSDIIYSGAPTEQISVVKNWKDWSTREKTILYAGKLIERKHVDWIVEAISALDKKSNVKLKIVGDGPERKNIESLINQLMIGEKVEMLGTLSRENTLSEMAKADVFCMPSTKETFGLVYLEAMASGCITIGTKNEGIDGVIIDNENGFLIENKEALLECIKRIVENVSENEAKRLSDKALETGKEFSEYNMSRRYLNLISDIEV